MLPPSAPSSSPPLGNVALFIDWENFKYSLYEVSRLPNINALLDAVRQRYGRPVIARAYADWQDYYHRRSWDQMSLYGAGIEPVYVPSRRSPYGQERIKNSVDVKMSLDCLEVSFTEPHIQTFVLVTGDADFLHVAAALRRRGAAVVMIGVSSSTSDRLEGIVDEIVFYDEEIDRAEAPAKDVPALEVPAGEAPPRETLPKEPVEAEAAPPIVSRPPRPALPDTTLEEAQALLLRLLREQRELEDGRNYPPLFSWISLKMPDRAPRFHPEKHGLAGFTGLISQMETQGLLLVEALGMTKRLWLPEDEAQVSKPPPLPPEVAAALAAPDNVPEVLRRDLADIVLTADDINNSHRDYMAQGLLARFLYNKGHWDPADLPPQAAPPRSDAWRTREMREIHKLVEDALDLGVLLRITHVDPYSGSEIPALDLNNDHPFVRKTFAEEDAR